MEEFIKLINQLRKNDIMVKHIFLVIVMLNSFIGFSQIGATAY